jgi:hypothetical protein
MAYGGHICHKNYEFKSTKGPAPASALSHGPDLHPRDLDSAIHGGHTLGTTLEGYILESTYIRGPIPILIIGCGWDFHRRGPQLVTNSPEEWPRPTTTFWETTQLTTPKG